MTHISLGNCLLLDMQWSSRRCFKHFLEYKYFSRLVKVIIRILQPFLCFFFYQDSTGATPRCHLLHYKNTSLGKSQNLYFFKGVSSYILSVENCKVLHPLFFRAEQAKKKCLETFDIKQPFQTIKTPIQKYRKICIFSKSHKIGCVRTFGRKFEIFTILL